MPETKLDFSRITWSSSVPKARSKAFEKGGQKIRLLEISNGFEEPEWCEKGHIGYVVEGELKINFNGKPVIFSQGDGIFIAAGEKHKAHPVTEKALLFLIEDA